MWGANFARARQKPLGGKTRVNRAVELALPSRLNCILHRTNIASHPPEAFSSILRLFQSLTLDLAEHKHSGSELAAGIVIQLINLVNRNCVRDDNQIKGKAL